MKILHRTDIHGFQVIKVFLNVREERTHPFFIILDTTHLHHFPAALMARWQCLLRNGS